jgi:hypothetical protein
MKETARIGNGTAARNAGIDGPVGKPNLAAKQR